MMTRSTRTRSTVALLAVTLASGVWVSNSPAPVGGADFAIHKLAAVAMAVLMAVGVLAHNRARRLSALQRSAVMVAGAALLALAVTGSLLSLELDLPPAVLAAHRVLPGVAVAACGAAALALRGRRDEDTNDDAHPGLAGSAQEPGRPVGSRSSTDDAGVTAG